MLFGLGWGRCGCLIWLRGLSGGLILSELKLPLHRRIFNVLQTKDGAEKRSVRTAPYGRGSVCRCKRSVSMLSRDHRERFQHFSAPSKVCATLFFMTPIAEYD